MIRSCRIRPMSLVILSLSLAGSGAARGDGAPPQHGGAGTGQPDFMDAARGPAAPPLPESQHEIRRPAGPEAGADQPASGSAAQTPDQRLVNRSGATGGVGRLVDFLPLLAVLALIAVAAWAVKRFMPARRLVTGAGVMEIVARLPVTGKQSLVLVKLGGRLILVGVSPERMNTVCMVDDPEQVALLIGRVASYARGGQQGEFDGSLEHESEVFDEREEEFSPIRVGGPVRGLLEKVRRLRQREVA